MPGCLIESEIPGIGTQAGKAYQEATQNRITRVRRLIGPVTAEQ